MPQFFVRDEDGTLIEGIDKPVNISRRVSRTLDLNVRKPFDTDFGVFEPGLHYYRVLDLFDEAVAGAEKAEFVGHAVGVDRYRLRGQVKWIYDDVSAQLVVHHTPGYIGDWFEATFRDIPVTSVGSYTTVDLTGTYLWRDSLTIRAGGRNILDRSFPFVLISSRSFDASRVDTRGRVLFLEAAWSLGG